MLGYCKAQLCTMEINVFKRIIKKPYKENPTHACPMRPVAFLQMGVLANVLQHKQKMTTLFKLTILTPSSAALR